MCLILMAFHVNARYPLVVAANRDEFYDRPSLPAGYWPENPSILAGKDLRGGGAWFGVTKEGRFAAITNFRDPLTKREGQRSRGLIVADYLTGSRAPDAFVKDLRRSLNQYNDFTVILGSAEGLFSYSNRDDVLKEVTRGFHGLSNHFIDTPWPKVTKGLAKLQDFLAGDGRPEQSPPLSILADASRPDDLLLPDTGVGLEWERILSPIFINHYPVYGTRSSTILVVDDRGRLCFIERIYRGDAEIYTEKSFVVSTHTSS